MISFARRLPFRQNPKFVFGGFAIAYVAIAVLALPGYIPFTSVNFILGLIGLPLVFLYRPAAKPSSRFYVVAVVLGLMAFAVPENPVLLAALGAAVIGIAERVYGKLSLLGVLMLGFMSPTMQYLAGIFSFPIRLWLTGVAGHILCASGSAASTAGNVIAFGGQDYSVDPACMGLKMLLTSLLFGLVIIAVLQHRCKLYLSGLWVCSATIMVFGLNLLANVTRILTLVYFHIMPGHTMHEVTGLVCLGVYVLVPATWVITKIIRRFGRESPIITGLALPGTTRFMASQVPLAVLLIAAAAFVNAKGNETCNGPLPQVAGYAAAWYDKDVMRYRDERALVYIKKIKGPLYGEHNPAICWLGSGYVFESIGEERVAGVAMYAGTLRKGKEILYTAWWYDNGSSRTTSQASWRWKVIKGARQYSIINVTASNKATLTEEIAAINASNLFKPAL